MRLIFSLLLVGAYGLSSAQNDPVSWTFALLTTDNGNWEIQAKAEVGDGWYIYSQHLDEGGPVPTEILLDSDNWEFVGKAKELGEPISGFDELFGMDIVKFKRKVTFVQEVRRVGERELLKGKVYYMVCNDEQCLPPRGVPFTLKKS